jgi:hypothetical protein
MKYPAALILAASALAAFPAFAQTPASGPAVTGNAEKGGVMRNLPANASEESIETRAADYCLHYALDYKITGVDPKAGTASFDCQEPGD